MTYEQLCPPSYSLGDGICVSYFLYQLNQFVSDHPMLLGLLIGFIFASAMSMLALTARRYVLTDLLDGNPDYIKQYAPGYIALGYTSDQHTREDVYIFKKLPQASKETPPPEYVGL